MSEQACRPLDKELLKKLIEFYSYVDDKQELMTIMMRKTRGHVNPKLIESLITEMMDK